MMENKEVQDLFHSFNQKYFWGKLDKVKLNWSKNMTLCAGKTYCKERRGSFLCSIYLSEPLLSQRPRHDTINTLLHEMIHAYLFVTEGSNHKMGHGPQFREHMTRINNLHGSKITVCHNFREEVDKFRVHVYRCDGPCRKKRPYFGELRRAISRPPGPTDRWWAKHSQECGGTFHKVEGPDISPDVAHNTHTPLRTSPIVPPGISSPHTPVRASPAVSSGIPFPKITSSQRRMDSPVTPTSGVSVRDARSDGNKLMSGVSKRLPFTPEKNIDDITCGEDQLIQKIKKRHAHTSRSILLSKEETRMKWRGISPERGTSVEGRVNYNYRMKSGLKFNIRKYLERYRAATGDTRTPQKTGMPQIPQASQNTQKLTRLQPSGVHTSRRAEDIKVSQASHDGKTCTSVPFKTGESSRASVPPVVPCWNCGVNVMVPEHVQHSQKVWEEESVCDVPKIPPQARKEDLEETITSTLVPCPSCGEKIPQENLNSHLDECLLPFTDDF